MIHIVVHDRKGILYTGMALALSGTNQIGAFDVLPEHANFVSVVTDGLQIHEKDAVKEVFFDRGILRVHENVVEVYVGI